MNFANPAPIQSRNTTDPNTVAGVELGGTKCICTLADGPNEILAQQTVATRDPEATLAEIGAILDKWWESRRFAAIGIASFGPVNLDPASAQFGHIGSTTKPGWPMTDVARRLSRPYPVPMAFDTDVNGAAAAELAWGSGKGLSDFAYITIGTGVGVGLIVNGDPTRGIGHCEMGHLRIPRLAGDTIPSGCRFHTDCVEGLASGTALKLALGGERVSEIGADHALWDRVAHAVTCLCHALVCTTGPQRIAIGGGVIARQPHLLPRIEAMLIDSLNGYLTLPGDRPYIVAPELGDQAGPLGPIALATARLVTG